MKLSQASICAFLEPQDFHTLLGVILVLMGALAAMACHFLLAALLLLLPVPCDYFDGKLAPLRDHRGTADKCSHTTQPLVAGRLLAFGMPHLFWGGASRIAAA